MELQIYIFIQREQNSVKQAVMSRKWRYRGKTWEEDLGGMVRWSQN